MQIARLTSPAEGGYVEASIERRGDDFEVTVARVHAEDGQERRTATFRNDEVLTLAHLAGVADQEIRLMREQELAEERGLSR